MRILLICLIICLKSYSQSLICIAGAGQGDGLPATQQSVNPSTHFADSIGNVYFTDSNYGVSQYYNSVRKVNVSTGIISTIAGGQNSAISSLHGSVSLLWLDHANMYILHGYVIKKINLNNNVITTIAGNGNSGNAGDGGLALNASINSNITMALDHNGDLYINDFNNNYIRKINNSNGIISSFVSQATSPLISSIGGMCIDNQNNLLLAAPFSNSVLKANLTTSVVSRFAGYGGNGNSGNGGLAINATLGAPWDVKIKNNGDVYIMDSNYDQVRMVNTSGIISSFYFGNFNVARNLNVDLQGNVYVSDKQYYFICKINSAGILNSIVCGNGYMSYTGNGGDASESDVNLPKEIHRDKNGNIYFIDQNYGSTDLGLCIRKIDKLTNIISTVAGNGGWGFSGDGGVAVNASFGGISDFAIDTMGNIFIADYDNRRIRKVDYSTGIVSTISGVSGNQYSGDGGLAINAGVPNVDKIATDLQGNIYIASNYYASTRIRKIDIATGIIDLAIGAGPGYADNVLGTSTTIEVGDMAFDSNNNLIITETSYNRVRRFNTSTGIITTIAGNGTNAYSGNNVPPLSASFLNIKSVRLDDHDNIYVSGGGKIRKIDSALTNIVDYISTSGTSEFYNGIPANNCNCLNNNPFEFDVINNEMFFSDTKLYKLNTVNCNTLNTPTLSLNVSNQCETMTALAVSTNADYYYWLNTGNYSNNLTTNIAGIYTVVASNSVGCSTTATVNNSFNYCVWPGDANSDGLANNLDVLELGLHFNQSGISRSLVGNIWQPYTAINWSGTITNGKNLHHSDCNGDGIINNNDTLAIYNNYGLMHALKTHQSVTLNPELSIIPDQSMVVKGMWGTASIYLGNAINVIYDVNGVAFTVDFDNNLIEPNGVYIEYQNSFIDVGQNLHFQKPDFTNGKIFSATTHTINNDVTGYGKIATLHYQIKSNLATDEVLNIGISQANQSSVSGMITSLSSGTATLMAIGASVGVNESLISGGMLISPNPTNGIINISFNTVPQNTKIELYNSIGALVLLETMSNKTNIINMGELSSGIYFMKVLEGNKVVTVKKVVRE